MRSGRDFKYATPVALLAFRAAFPDRRCQACPCHARTHDIVGGCDVACTVCKKTCAHVFGAGEFRRAILRWAAWTPPHGAASQ
jgi:hypothetical protein